jgi:mRNA interferase MazF
MAVGINRFEVWMINLDPTQGSEINKTRPCLVISPDEVNHNLNTVIVAALTSTRKPYPSRVNCVFEGKPGQVALDQIRSVDKTRFLRKLGVLEDTTCQQVCLVLQELFQY